VLALEGERGGPRHDTQSLDFAQRVDDLLGHAVREVLVVRVGAHVGEREHRHRWRLLLLALANRLPHAAQLGHQLPGRLEARFAVLLQAPGDEAV
jgi:hypothetical protein